ncbi:MAG: dTMP kinase [Candidatus Liptonbacteria bacterium]|nr:dTMP kinase [Candidatus Liptonbacteria bacterium]
MFIVAEGITCTGKTTQMKMLADRINSKGGRAFFNHEPTKASPYGKIIRRIVEKREISPELIKEAKNRKLIPGVIEKLEDGKELTELERQSIYMADRRENLIHTVIPKIARGATVLQDRYEMSTFAYGATKDISEETLRKRQKQILEDVYLRPDIILYFDLDPQTAVERLKLSGKQTDIYETLSKIKKTRAAYKKLLKNKDFYRTLYAIDASESLDEVFNTICFKLNLW